MSLFPVFEVSSAMNTMCLVEPRSSLFYFACGVTSRGEQLQCRQNRSNLIQAELYKLYDILSHTNGHTILLPTQS